MCIKLHAVCELAHLLEIVYTHVAWPTNIRYGCLQSLILYSEMTLTFICPPLIFFSLKLTVRKGQHSQLCGDASKFYR